MKTQEVLHVLHDEYDPQSLVSVGAYDWGEETVTPLIFRGTKPLVRNTSYVWRSLYEEFRRLVLEFISMYNDVGSLHESSFISNGGFCL